MKVVYGLYNFCFPFSGNLTMLNYLLSLWNTKMLIQKNFFPRRQLKISWCGQLSYDNQYMQDIQKGNQTHLQKQITLHHHIAINRHKSSSPNIMVTPFTQQGLPCKFTNIHSTTIQLYCRYVEKFAFWLVIYIKKHSIQLTIKHQQLNKTRS